MAILQALERKRVIVCILKLGLDTQPPGGKLRPRVLGGVAQLGLNASTPTARRCQSEVGRQIQGWRTLRSRETLEGSTACGRGWH